MLITLIRIIKTGIRNFVRNAWLSTAATVVMTVTLSLVAVSYIANAALTSAIEGVVNKIDISIFLDDANSKEQNEAFRTKLEHAENVKSVRFLTKADALKEYRKNPDNPKLPDTVTETDNPLPASFQIKAEDPNKIDGIITVAKLKEFEPLLAKDKEGSREKAISYSGERKATIDKIISTSNFLRVSGIIASLIFVVISTLIIFNTIRMAIFTRREEIEIMKLVGATSWFIRGPFIFEAILYGVIAAILALIFLYTVVLAGAPRISSYIPEIDAIIAYMKSHVAVVALIELAIGVAIGALSSLVALKRYLKL